MSTNLTEDRFFLLKKSSTSMSLWKRLWFCELFSGDKGDYIDVWMMKITIKTNQIDMNVCFFFPIVYWFVNLTLTDKHGAKNLYRLIGPSKCEQFYKSSNGSSKMAVYLSSSLECWLRSLFKKRVLYVILP